MDEQIHIIEDYQQSFAKLYGTYPQNRHPHYIFACHAAYPSVITADLLYQIWYNFRSYKLPNGKLEQIPFEAVNDFLLSPCCNEIGAELYKVDNEVRGKLLKDLKEILGKGHFERMVRFLKLYTEKNTSSRYESRIKDLHKQTVEISLDPATALRKFSETLGKEDLSKLDLIKLKLKLDTYQQDNEVFQKLNRLVQGAMKGIAGEAQNEVLGDKSVEVRTQPVIALLGGNELASSRNERRVAQETSEIQELLEGHMLIQTESAQSLQQVFKPYEEEVKILHYAGIPIEDLQDDNPGNLAKIQIESARTVLEYLDISLELKLVFLNTDNSDIYTETLFQAGAACVIGTTTDVSETIAQEFAKSFYESLVEGSSIRDAFTRAKNKMDSGAIGDISIKQKSSFSKKAPSKKAAVHFPYELFVNESEATIADQGINDWKPKTQASIQQSFAPTLNLNRHIDLSNQGLTEIPREVLEEPAILSLNLSNNRIAQLPPELANLKQLRQLNLNNNPHLDVYSFDWSQLRELESLQMSRIDLNSLPRSLSYCDSLKHLKLYRNELREFPEGLQKLWRLELLDLSYNQIPELPDWIAGFEYLQRFHLEWNLIREIPQSIGNLKQLQVLQIHANNLRSLPAGIWELNELQPNTQDKKYLMGLRLELNPFPFSIPPEKFAELPQALISYVMKEQERVGGRTLQIVHTLLIGIDKYMSADFHPLEGCVSDARKVGSALQKKYGESYDLRLHSLFNEDATKEGIVRAFRMLGENVSTGDTIFLYFAGHSHYEKTHRNWDLDQPSDLLEGLTCYDTTADPSGPSLLSSMELRYLYNELSVRGAKILSVFDTHLNGDFKLGENAHVSAYPQRDWADFIFSGEKEDPGMQKSPTLLDTYLPEGNTMHIYATSTGESAHEKPNQQGKVSGMFTDAFLKIVEENNWELSYASLQRKLQNYLAEQLDKNFMQTPKVVAAKHLAGELFTEIISSKEIENPIEANLKFNPFTSIWSIDLGALHGLTMDGDISVGVSTDQGLQTAEISRLLTSSAEIAFSSENTLNEGETYRAFVLGMEKVELHIYVNGDKEGKELLENYRADATKADQVKGISFVENRQEAHYEILAKEGSYHMISVGDERPLSFPVSNYSSFSLDVIFDRFNHIREWRAIKELQNSAVEVLKDYPIGFFLHPPEGEVLEAKAAPDTNYLMPDRGQYRLEFRNQGKQTVFISMLYLSSEFEVDPDLLQPRVVEFFPGNNLFALGGESVRLEIPKYAEQFNWEEEIVYVKLILSTQSFDPSVFKLEALGKEATRRAVQTRSLDSGASSLADNFDASSDWMTLTYELRIRNLAYQGNIEEEQYFSENQAPEQEEWDQYDGYEMEE